MSDTHETVNAGRHTTARVIADMLGDPGFEHEIEEGLRKRSRINALVSERAKAGITVEDMAKEMHVTVEFVREFEDSITDSEAEPRAIGLYADALRSLSTLGKD